MPLFLFIFFSFFLFCFGFRYFEFDAYRLLGWCDLILRSLPCRFGHEAIHRPDPPMLFFCVGFQLCLYCVCMSVCLYVCVSVRLCVCVPVCLHACVSVCLYCCFFSSRLLSYCICNKNNKRNEMKTLS